MKIGIALFSGTGNTAHVARLLASELQSLGATVEIHPIDSTNSRLTDEATGDFDPARYDLVGIGHPVLGFGATPLVLRFAEAFPHGSGRIFIFKSAADNHPLNNAASEQLIRILGRKGYDVVHDFLYVMPCNWVITYQRRFNLQTVDKAQEKASQHARDLMTGVRSLMPVYRGWRCIARFFHYLESNYGRKEFGKSLRAKEDCNLCGHCIRNCPMKNIREERGVVRFGENCIWCMRCVYSCPAKAIDARWMSWCIVKGGYRLKDYLGASDTDRTFITSKSRGYWKHFREYFA